MLSPRGEGKRWGFDKLGLPLMVGILICYALPRWGSFDLLRRRLVTNKFMN
jgi:hypothetical protein